jgi:hypothetical protein
MNFCPNTVVGKLKNIPTFPYGTTAHIEPCPLY